MKILSRLYLVCVCSALTLICYSQDPPVHRLFVINSPSDSSLGPDSILTFDLHGESRVFFGANKGLLGLDDIACSPDEPKRTVVSHTDFAQSISELLEFNASGKREKVVPFGTPGGNIALAFDRAGNFYVGEGTTIFKNGALFASLPNEAIEAIAKLAADSEGNLYITSFVSSQLFRSDPVGHVTLFASAINGLNTPYGLAIDSTDHVFVANNPPSAPAFILKFEQSGTASSFATGISFQPIIRGMTFDGDDNLYATLESVNEILKFDTAGNSSVFADAKDGLKLPAAITARNCR